MLFSILEINSNLFLLSMNNVGAVNDIKKRRTELIRQLQMLMQQRAQRETYISKDLNRQIHKLETEIHEMTIKHREEIKKCYSGARRTTTITAK